MLFGRYEFTCRLETGAELPHYKGSTIRGVFGRALKSVVCALKHQECGSCLLRSKCVYATVFETPDPAPARDARINAPPHPFVIEPPLTAQTLFPAGASLDFGLLLMGETNFLLPYFIYAFEQMGKIGIGRQLASGRGRFSLETVRCFGETLYAAQTRALLPNNSLKTLALKPRENFPDAAGWARLTLETPLRLKFDNKLQAFLPFHVLVRSMIRRMSSLLNAYGRGEPDLDYKGMVRRAENIAIAENRLSWYDWRRYSARQDEKMLMGGMTGGVTYAGDMGEYLPLLDFCRQTHLGKQTTFGLGKIRVETGP